MEVLWDMGAGTVADVAEVLKGKTGTAYNTILTLMRILREKGYLTCRKQGRAHIYKPRVNRQAAARRAVTQLLGKFFDNSPGELVLNFLENEDLQPDELGKLVEKIKASQEEEEK